MTINHYAFIKINLSISTSYIGTTSFFKSECKCAVQLYSTSAQVSIIRWMEFTSVTSMYFYAV